MPAQSKKVVVKFRPEAVVRDEGAAFTAADNKLADGLRQVLAAYPGAQLRRLITRPTAGTAADTRSAKDPAVRAANETLNRYYCIDVSADEAAALAERLRNLPGVAMAYVEPDYDVASKQPDTLLEGMVLTAACPPGPVLCPPAPAILCPPSPFVCPPGPILITPDLSSNQTYLEAASAGGLDARYAWTKQGGKGLNMHFADIEFGWNVSHEDLNTSAATSTYGTNDHDEHGTQVLGEIVSEHNGFGVMGIAPDAQVAVLCSISDKTIADCISHAAGALNAGDVILIELQTGYRPVEVVEANYDAIVAAVATGVVVVEAAGNGAFDLDSYVRPASAGGGGKILSRSVRDSGAIMVGSACPPSGTYGPHRSRWLYSNFGSRLDVQGQGREVCTTGEGDLWDGGPNRKYTGDFKNTSAASPQIVGSVLCLQGIRKAKGDAVLSPADMRTLLINTGSAQVNGNYGPATQHIGPQPDLSRAYKQLYPTLVCPSPIIVCKIAPHIPMCPPAPYFVCKPSPFVLECKSGPALIKCPPAPKICTAGPVLTCAAGPNQGWEDPRDWVDPIWKYDYIDNIGHVLVLVRKGQMRPRADAEVTPSAEAAEAAAYGYGEVYWNYNAVDMKTAENVERKAGEKPGKTKSSPADEFNPTSTKRKK